MQRRLIQKRVLEILLSKVKPHPAPKLWLEQYTIPPEIASEILHLAAYTYQDIFGKIVFDLGCGTGRLGIGAAILGAKEVVGVDIDPVAVMEARINARLCGVEAITSWVATDIDVINGSCDTVVQNPPFGVQRRAADRKFLQKALQVGEVVYSLHKSGANNREFISKFVRNCGGEISGVFQMTLMMPCTFPFHRERRHRVKVDLYRIVRGNKHARAEC